MANDLIRDACGMNPDKNSGHPRWSFQVGEYTDVLGGCGVLTPQGQEA